MKSLLRRYLYVIKFQKNVVENLPQYESEKEELLISYLAAVSQFPSDLFESIQHLSEVDSIETPDTNDTLFYNRLSQCFRTDFEGSMISGALEVAIEEINANPNLLSNYKLVYLFNNTCGDEKRSTEFFMDHWKRGAKVFIGPEMNCRTEATMAASQNLPIISYKCKDQTVSDKIKYPTFARTVPAETEITKALIALLKHFNWHKFTIIYERHSRNEELHSAIKAAIETENSKNNAKQEKFQIRNVSVVSYPFSEVEKSNVEQIIRDTHSNTRIYLTFGNVRLFRRILLIMGALGLMDNGEYVLIYLDTDYNWHNVYHAMNSHFFRDTMIGVSESWDVPTSPDRQVVNYSKTALAVIPTPVKLDSKKFTNFWEKASTYLINFGVQKPDTDTIKANRFACYLYDAVMLYAQALDEVLRENKPEEDYDPLTDGELIISKILGRKYTSMQGFDMRINEKGDAQGNYTLLSLQSVPPVHNASDPDYYPLDVALTISADFVGDDSHLPKLRFSRKMNWPNNHIPLDEPECGFGNEKCQEESTLRFQLFMGSTIAVVLSICALTILIVYRNKKFERELSMIWKIDPREIEKVVQCNTSTNSLFLVDGSRTSLLHRDDISTDKKWSGLRGVALHKGAVVAIKEMCYSKKPREITRATKLEMKAMRALHHDNVNSFMGIIICPMSICVVREFCAKSSLMDILRNRDLKLDSLFITSFIEDLIKGMIYLHESDVKVHGNLKSTNCLITSRWALQVADFGLSEIREGQEWDSIDLLWESYLWTAPELLRECEFIHAVKGTQKGDVYSFAIILHEMMTRQGPYQLIENPHSTAEEVVRKVATGTMYRPSLELECQKYVIDTMTLCWSEIPEHRPDFRNSIRHKLKQMFSQIYKRNIMDHMMDMMERYQQQLEGLVEERTAQLREEKRRTENLLQRMLPISVAQQLLLGKDVVPELFSSVTIYFSDIVGFTTLSGESTPMEVVAFLNKLYTLFDSIIKQYEVYKVETIGDAYMVVSGVPEKKDKHMHAEQIGTMALHLLAAVENFRIPHKSDEILKLRIGIHTGPCVAGVVGKTMPRYCLFGDTVNTASRMESCGEPLKIHCSSSFVKAIEPTMGFILEERGELEIKGKGTMRTYWLQGRDGYDFSSDDEAELSDDDLAPEIFPRASIRQGMNSVWTLNKGSCLSLPQKDGAASTMLLKKLVETAAARTPILPLKDDPPPTKVVIAPLNLSQKEISPPYPRHKSKDYDCESHFSISTQPNLPIHLNSCSTISTERYSQDYQNLNGFEQHGNNSFDDSPSFNTLTHCHLPAAIRKRSTSLPEGEVLKINHFNPHALSSTAPHSTSPSPAVAARKNAVVVNYEGTFDQVIRRKISRISENDSSAPRKRSLSYGDNAIEMVSDAIAAAANQTFNADSPLITPPAQRKRRFRKERKSALSLQNNYETEILAKKPLQHPSLRERSPVTSFSRIWRKFMTEGGEGGVGSGTSLKESSTSNGGPINPNPNHLPMLPIKVSIQDECLDKLLEETDNSMLNENN
uniref:Guanylate cyclase n=1 Tax=Panagrolaimus superbus TaxID=310955 RepID=A0A914Z0Q9_9BILA